MTITLRQKDLANGNKSLFLDIYDKGKRKFEYLSLYLLPEVNDETRERNRETIGRAQNIRLERIIHPETITTKSQAAAAKEKAEEASAEVMDWIQTSIDWMDGNAEYSKSVVTQTRYLQDLMRQFLESKHKPHITLCQFDRRWFKSFFHWLKNDYVPQKYVRIEAKPLSGSSLRNVQQRIVAVFNKAVKCGKLNANPFYQLGKEDCIPQPNANRFSHPKN